MASSLPSTFLPSHRFRYDVFLNFKGEDTRNNFTDHLYTALVNAGYHTFRDGDVGLERGKNISSELERAIRESKLSIIVFSKGYASSRWCLDELANILELKKSAGHMVLPIFYHVDPSDVRKQTGTFADAFARHETRFHEELNRVERWRAALREVADLAGLSLQDGSEAKFIQEIVEKIERKLNLTVLAVGGHLIGANYRVEDINSWLQDGSSEIGIGAICGMGGIGKTTIAKIAYNMNVNKFEGSSFLANIREECSKSHNGLVRLQRQLISDIQKRNEIKINNVHEGLFKIKKALCRKRVLMFFDDVEDEHQLDAILGNMGEWLSPGSKIIITTRNERVLKGHKDCKVFKVTELDEYESLELFSWLAFQQDHPIEGYMALSRSIVKHCGGLPLALQVLGSFLCGRSVVVWASEIKKLEVIPNREILKTLMISYDSLQDDHDKNLFLDIACFFVGRDRNYTITILDGCDFYTMAGIHNLADRCLITIDNEDKLQMHQLLQDMGREIIRQESPEDPGKRSRLWAHHDAFNVLRSKTGTETIEGLFLNFPVLDENMHEKTISGVNNPKHQSFEVDAFARMHRLRLLSLNYVQLTGGFNNFPKDMRWLCWHGFPMQSIPVNFSLENLVALEMHNSCLTYLWKGTKFLGNLKILDVSYSHSLIRTPDVSGLPSLERLILKDCISLVEVHESIGILECLVFLSLEGCKNLRKLPRHIGNFVSLNEINLSGCSKVEPVKSEESSQFWHSMWSMISRRQRPEKIVNSSSSSMVVVPVYSSRIAPKGKFRQSSIESWQKGAFLGSGSFGTVYKGFTDNGLFLAVKEVSLLDKGSQGQQSILQLEQEISLLSQFEHENIVQYFGTAKDEARLYIFLELVTEGSLLSLYGNYTLRDSQASIYTRQILNGLKYLHERNVVHRDIKCANILVHASGSVKLADFGLAKATISNDIKSCQGTAFWMAPEVVRSKENGYGLAADIWSLGCTVLEMLTGQHPYSNLEWMEAAYRIGQGEPPLVPDSLSSNARDFIHKCLQVNPDNRPAAAQLLEHSFIKRSTASKLIDEELSL